MSFAEQINLELDEMEKLGVVVPAGAYAEARDCAGEYEEGGMSVSEAASLCIEVGSLR